MASNRLFIGIGNPGRRDDGIGWTVLDTLQEMGTPGTYEYRFQLNVEDAELISHFPTIIMVDASQAKLPQGHRSYKVKAQPSFTFSTHELPPSAVAHLCAAVFERQPDIQVLEIQGYQWDIGEGISEKAQANISRAIHSLVV